MKKLKIYEKLEEIENANKIIRKQAEIVDNILVEINDTLTYVIINEVISKNKKDVKKRYAKNKV